MLTSTQIRQQFLDFFAQKGHLIVPSAPIVSKNDPTLMFNNSGMAQFKDFFLGNGTPPAPRIANTQKCLRVTGKHNDLEDVGHDTYHHTMFEMLGNWSFGDYFKKEAIAWSWELLTEVYKLPKDRLYATVFEGDSKENLEKDLEAYEIWQQYLPKEHILFGNKKDNFWEMGETGPCGPCSEIHIDLRSDEERQKIPGHLLVNKDNPLVIEIWNNVFMQFERRADKSLVPLPAKHVDTGMGFERLCMAIQGKTSNYDTDIFQPLIQFIAQKVNVKYGQEHKTDVALRVVADHIRAVAFAIADGQVPSNNKAGYVIRRILRRAVRYGYSYLGFREPFMCTLVPVLAQQFEQVFPELAQQQGFVANIIREEENAFLRTLENGLNLLDNLIQQAKNQQRTQISGSEVFKLYDTFGFPADLTALIAREHQLTIDEKGFETEMLAQKERARNAQAKETDDWVELQPSEQIQFVGYDIFACEANVIKYRKITQKDKTFYQIVLDRTPFYAESGGQVGDAGTLTIGNATIKIIDTKKENDLIVHLTSDNLPTILQSEPTATVFAQIDLNRRKAISANHSATHLMHAALREVLGKHVAQKGQLVNEHLLRFDFSHFTKISENELQKIEALVNQKIRQAIALDEQRNVPLKKAIEEMKAIALFGEKYGESVRVITFDENFSRELCGGTHVSNTAQIGLFKIISESSSAAGVRRIEAITAEKAESYINTKLQLIEELNALLKNPKDLKKAIETLLEEKAQLQKTIETFEKQQIAQLKQELLQKIEQQNGLAIIIQKVQIPSAEALKQVSFDLRNRVENLVLVLGAEIQEKPMLSIMLSESVVKEKGLNAAQMVRELAKHIQGGGGGQPFYATAGGKNTQGLEKALEEARERWVGEALGK
ncbi:MAG: alanine--tRNA ligase [Microscillaceae bacterium]|nr:alanine--tRNA ligase [Microscillaceae bacterium]MDW8459792.1 alanine--tRNA ligase [Cytophagales bacterium]